MAGKISRNKDTFYFLFLKASSAFDDDNLWWLTWHGIPYSKIVGLVGVEYGDGPSEDQIVEWTDKIKDLGLGGLKLNSINRENMFFSGQYVKMIAYHLYL